MTPIRVTPGQISISLDFRATSALAGCTELDSDDEGLLFIAALWPSLSSGETLLWRILDWLKGGHDCPTRADLEAGLDRPNLSAALHAIAVGSGVTA